MTTYSNPKITEFKEPNKDIYSLDGIHSIELDNNKMAESVLENIWSILEPVIEEFLTDEVCEGLFRLDVIPWVHDGSLHVDNQCMYCSQTDRLFRFTRPINEDKKVPHLNIENAFHSSGVFCTTHAIQRYTHSLSDIDTIRWNIISQMSGKILAFNAEYTNKDGRFTKRLSKFLRDEIGLNIKKIKSDKTSLIEQIGNLASVAKSKINYAYFDITNGIGWRDGDYADSGSCYWNERAGAREMVESENGGAIRFYLKSDVGCRGNGRAFIIPKYNDENELEGYVVFNSYGQFKLPVVAEILAKITGMNSSKISFTNNGSTGGVMWINSAYNYFINNLDSENVPSHIDLHIESISENYSYCAHCEEPYDNEVEGAYIENEGIDVCDSCLENHFSQCDDSNCYEWHKEEDIVRTHVGDFCSDHLSENEIYQCDECEDFHHTDNLHRAYDNEDLLLCEACKDYHTKECENDNCYHIVYDEENLIEVYNGLKVCDECIEEYQKCDYCNEYHPENTLHLNADKNMCNECFILSPMYDQYLMFWLTIPDQDNSFSGTYTGNAVFNPTEYIESLDVSPTRIEV